MKQKERAERIINYFVSHHPDAETELKYSDPYELLVAVILSAQCTDKRVNMVTPALFKRFPDVHSLSKSDPEEVFAYIRSISYPNNKSKHLVGMAKMILEKYKGQVPDSKEELQKLPGVGRKTANVIASVIFNIPSMAVDTHVFRVAARTGLSVRAKNPLQTENQLVKIIPEEYLSIAHHWLILHGRYVCTARHPKCSECGIHEYCLFYEKRNPISSKFIHEKSTKSP